MRRLLILAPLAVLAAGGCGHGTGESLVLDRSIGKIRLKESRARIERAIGRGMLVTSKLDRAARPEPVREEQVAYDRRSLIVWYVSDRRHAPRALVVKTTSPRYRTHGGIGVGSSFEQLRRIGVDCYGTDCQHFHGHNKPGTLFRLTAPAPEGRVSEIILIAYTD